VLAASVWPCCDAPLIAGAAVLDGAGTGATVLDLAEVAEADPPALLAVTITSIVSPTSEA
jgi:hypothetical protein